jgi:DNA polymerase (family 10)
METRQIVATLEEMADLLELAGANPFKSRSYRNAARALEGLADDVRQLVQEGTLGNVQGIGKTLVEVITELVETAGSTRLDELRDAVPAGLLDVVRIPGVGPKKAKLLFDELGVSGVEDLEAACQEGRVSELKGFGDKTQAKILNGIAYRRTVAGRFLFAQAADAVTPLWKLLEDTPGVARLQVGGSVRRRRETIKDIDFLVSVKKPTEAVAIMDTFVDADGVVDIIAHGETKSSIRMSSGIQADLRVVDDASFPYALQYFTGSKEHNTALRGLARDKGMKLNEYGLFEVNGDEEKLVECKDEATIYGKLGLDYIEPELRENMGEIDLAASRSLPVLVARSDLRGIVHVHTTFSDGHNTLEEMVDAARAMGVEYLGITDHSQSAGYAGGLKKKDIEKQHREIDALNERLDGFRIFKGIESDIRVDGSLDYPEDVLDLFDFIIASVHSGFQLAEKDQTERVIRALEDPHTTFLAHPTGRLLLERDAYAINMERVLESAGELGVCVEINASPLRLDLDWRLGNFARRHGVKTAISPDAHSTDGLSYVDYGIGIARKAGFSKEEVVNTYSVGEFEEFIALRKRCGQNRS